VPAHELGFTLAPGANAQGFTVTQDPVMIPRDTIAEDQKAMIDALDKIQAENNDLIQLAENGD